MSGNNENKITIYEIQTFLNFRGPEWTPVTVQGQWFVKTGFDPCCILNLETRQKKREPELLINRSGLT